MNEEERLILFLSFLELIKLDKKVETEELQFVEFLASELHISRHDYQNSLMFILCDFTEAGHEINHDFLTITGSENNNYEELEGSWIEQNRPPEKDKKLFIVKKDLEGDFMIMKLQGINFLAGRYFGDQTCLLNNRKIFPEKFFLISQFDQLKVGNNIRLTFQDIMTGFKVNTPNASLIFAGENISTVQKKTNSGFAPFNFCEELGNLVVILCNDYYESRNISYLLTGQIKLDTGKIIFNSYNIYNERYRVHKMIGYVPFEPVYDSNISITQNFRFSARLAFPPYSEEKVQQLVEQTISNLGLEYISRIPVKILVILFLQNF
ncbi:MAG: hypothetical protein HC905_20720 [Bacteroidales bacterium]|nr:hypothetical protein [Bacteroidales bacterium]